MSHIIKAGVIGDPIHHSLSPTIHGYWLQKYGIQGEYDAYHVDIKKVSDFVDFAVENLAGFNITTPHKETILSYCNEISTVAQAVGAVNTVWIDKNGKIFGDNTDVYGVMECLMQNAKLTRKHTVCIIGAGGASRSAIQAFKHMNFKHIIIANRTLSKAEKLATEFSDTTISIQGIEISQIHTYIHKTDVLVNTSVAGMNGQNPLDIDLSIADSHMIVYDIVYKPLMTPLLIQAEKLGLQIVTGIDMLLYQALRGFYYWFGIYPKIDNRLREIVL